MNKLTVPFFLYFMASAHAAVTTSFQTPFTDSVVAANGARSEVVKLSGQLFVVAAVTQPGAACQPNDPCRGVTIVVAQQVVASGVGQTTHATYLAAGTSQVQGTFVMPGAFSKPIGLRLFASPLAPFPAPITPPNPIDIQTVLSVNSVGKVTSATLTPSGLVSWWKAEGNAADATGNNPGTLQGGVSFAAGKVGQAFNFAGSGSVDVPSSPSLQPSSVTAMAWVRHLGVPGPNNYVLSQGADGCKAASYALYTSLGNLFFGIYDGSGYVQSADAGPAVWDGNWHLVAGTYDGVAVHLYVDGVEAAPASPGSIAINYALPTNNDFHIGAYRAEGVCELGFNGDIDEVRIFNRALSAAEIQSCVPSGLVSWWKAEGNAADATGNNPGTLQGSVSFAAGKVGQAFNFAGSGSVDVPSSPSLQPSSVTAMAWVRHLGVPGPNNYVLSQGADGCKAASYALYTSLGNLFFGIYDGSGYVQSADAGPAVWDGNWHLVAGSYDGVAVHLYVDGVEAAPASPGSIAINYALPTNNDFHIGAYRAEGVCELGFNGDIDEVRIFNRALNAAEIQSFLSAQ